MAVALALILGTALAGSGGPTLAAEPAEIHFRGSRDETQLLVTGSDQVGRPVDLTRSPNTRYRSLDPGVAAVGPSGLVRPSGNGRTTIRIDSGPDGFAEVAVAVERFGESRPVGFASEVVPVFSKLGCNAATCHGKTSGQNGFRLSLLGSDPASDFESLARDGRGRRTFPAAPSASLLLRKPTADLPHGGGRRLEPGSTAYRTLADWIGQGMPFDRSGEAHWVALEVRPARRVVAKGGSQQLRVVARRSDGVEADVTRRADYRSGRADLVEADGEGFLKVGQGTGEASLMVRFGGLVASATVAVPLGTSVPAWEPPAPRSFVDRLVFETLAGLGVPPSPACDDASFARRSSLDLCGELPAPGEVEALERDGDPEKRVRWVERLLERPAYADRFAMVWSALLRNKRTLGAVSAAGTFAFHDWVRAAFAENRPYDKFVADLLTARGDGAESPPVVLYRQWKTDVEAADDAAQLFLGLRLGCARCHHHPYERWGQDDYYGFVAFFSRVGRKPGDDPATPRVFVESGGNAVDPVSGRSYEPRWLGDASPVALKPGDDPRRVLAGRLTRPENREFSRALVNRYWAHFFGRGLVDPEDDLRASNPPTNPGLLDALADDFAGHGFDLKRLARTIATSRAYERSSEPNAWNRADDRAFSRFLPRRLPAEVLLDAIDTLAGTAEAFPGLPRDTRAVGLPDDGFDTPGRFLDVFGRPARETVCGCERSAEASLSQSLHLLNAAEVEAKITSPEGRAARLADDPSPDPSKVEDLYRAAFSRRPTAEERDVCLAHLRKRRSAGAVRQGFEDLIWTLINTKEFQFVR